MPKNSILRTIIALNAIGIPLLIFSLIQNTASLFLVFWFVLPTLLLVNPLLGVSYLTTKIKTVQDPVLEVVFQ